MDRIKEKIIAFYLPQFHPIPINDKWHGKGFTEWTNVAKAKPLFKNHHQPHVPADLGFYDLRLPETKEAQALLAREAGISAFCYWHYWFGDGKQLLEKPLQDVIATGNPDFPFCIAWANHTWQRKNWDSEVSRLSREIIITQTYPGREDVDNHFYTMLPTFKDKRYFRIDDKLVFVIYNYEVIPDLNFFIDRWQDLANENGLSGFYFIAHVTKSETINDLTIHKFDAINLHLLGSSFNQSRYHRLLSWILNRPLGVVSYLRAMYKWENEIIKEERVFPTIYPNWDTTPRINIEGQVLLNSTPTLFKKHVKRILNLIKNKKDNNKVIFLKSWNEWAEGNYMEPDLRFGKGYITALKEALVENNEVV
jgi:hypothetical protein